MIPAEAVEAAIRTMPEYTPEDEADSFDRETNDMCRAKVERILEAAAPYMLAGAWACGHHDGAVDQMLHMENGGAKTTPNPYMLNTEGEK